MLGLVMTVPQDTFLEIKRSWLEGLTQSRLFYQGRHGVEKANEQNQQSLTWASISLATSGPSYSGPPLNEMEEKALAAVEKQNKTKT